VHNTRCTTCNAVLTSEEDQRTHFERSNLQGKHCRKVEGLSENELENLKQLKCYMRERQARWENIYRHLFPAASSIPDPWFENEGPIEDESDLRTRVEAALPSEIAALIEARPDIIECFSLRLQERFRTTGSFGSSNINLEAPYADMSISDDIGLGQNPFDDMHMIGGLQFNQTQPDTFTNNHDSQEINFDFRIPDSSSLHDTQSNNSSSQAYQNGYSKGHEVGYQQGQRDGYKACKEAAEQRYMLSSSPLPNNAGFTLSENLDVGRWNTR